MTHSADTDPDEWRIPIYPIRKQPIPLLLLVALTAACMYGILFPFLHSGTFTRAWYHVTHISIPLLSQCTTPTDKAGFVALAQTDALAAGIPPDLFVKQITMESGFNPDDLSSAGAEGIAQFMPDTAAGLGIDPWNPVDAIQGAAQLMSRYNRKYGGDYAKALAAYNGGSGTLQYCVTHDGSQWFSCEPAQTQAYIQKIMYS